MKVLINSLSLKPQMGGGLTFGLGLARALHRSAGEHEVVLLGHRGNAELLHASGCRVAPVPRDLAFPAKRILFEHTGLRQHVAQAGANVYLSLDGIIPAGLNVTTVAILQNTLYFHRSQSLAARGPSGARRTYLNLQSRYFLRGWRHTARRADACVFVSDSMREGFARRYPDMRAAAHVIGEAPDPVFTPGPPPDSVDRPYLLGVGTLYPYKRFDRLIRLLAALSDCPELTARIVGPNWGHEKAHLQRLAESLGVAERVEFLGHCSADELVGHYRGALCLCVFSDFESFGLPLVEAMACGTPALVADCSAMPEVGGDGAFARDPERTAEFAAHVRRLSGDEICRAEWSARALERSKSFTWSAIADSYWRLFSDLERTHVAAPRKKRDAPESVQNVS